MTLFVNYFACCTIVAALAWLLCRIPALRIRPSLCHALWGLVLLRLVTPPVAQFQILSLSAMRSAVAYEAVDLEARDERRLEVSNAGLQSIPANEDSSRDSSAVAVDAVRPLEKTMDNKRATETTTAADPTSNARPSSTIPVLLLTTSLMGTLALWCVVIRQFLQVRRLFCSPAVISGRATNVLHKTATRFQLRRFPGLIIVDASLTPMLWAGSSGGPTIILPWELAESLDEEQLEQVIAHELAHWCRFDHWTNLMGLVVVSLVWWNPIAWFARRELLAAAETSCDAMAVERLGGSRKSYASTLLRVIDFLEQQRPQRHALGTMFGSSQSIRVRFQSICDSKVRASVSFLGRALLIPAAATLLVLPVVSQETVAPALLVPTALFQVTASSAQDSVGLEDTSVATDLVAVLGEDHSRLWGAPRKLVIEEKRDLIYLPETNGHVSVFNAETLRRVKSLPLHKERCLDVALADGGAKLVSIAMDGMALLWDISSDPPTQLDKLEMTTEPRSLKMSATKNGDRIAIRSDNEIAVFDIRDGHFEIRLRLSKDKAFTDANVPYECALSPDGNWLVICEMLSASTHVTFGKASYGYRDAKLVLWDLALDQPELVCELDGKDLSNLEFSPDSSRLFAIDPYFVPDRKIREWLVHEGELIPESSEAPLPGLMFSFGMPFVRANQLKALAHGTELTITAMEGTQTVSRGTLQVGTQIRNAAFLGDDIVLIADSLLQRWDWRDGKYQRRQLPSGHQSSVAGLLFDADTGTLVSASEDSVFEWTPPTKSNVPLTSAAKLYLGGAGKIVPWNAEKGFVLQQQLAPTVVTDQKVISHQAIKGVARDESGEFSQRFSIPFDTESASGTVWCLAMHPTEPILATGHHGSQICLWEIGGDAPVRLTEWKAHKGHVCDVAFSPDGNRIVSVGWDSQVNLWEIEPDDARAGVKPAGNNIGTHADIVRSVAWSHDGRHLASGGEDGQILLWDFEDGEPGEPRSLMNAEDGEPVRNKLPQITVSSLEFAQSGARLLSADARGRVCIWSVSSGEQIKRWQFPGWIWEARFSPDESTIATANNDGTICILRLPAFENAPSR